MLEIENSDGIIDNDYNFYNTFRGGGGANDLPRRTYNVLKILLAMLLVPLPRHWSPPFVAQPRWDWPERWLIGGLQPYVAP